MRRISAPATPSSRVPGHHPAWKSSVAIRPLSTAVNAYRRRILQGRIDLLRAELQARLQHTRGTSVLEDVDLDR
jgi:hypothetical protein